MVPKDLANSIGHYTLSKQKVKNGIADNISGFENKSSLKV